MSPELRAAFERNAELWKTNPWMAMFNISKELLREHMIRKPRPQKPSVGRCGSGVRAHAELRRVSTWGSSTHCPSRWARRAKSEASSGTISWTPNGLRSRTAALRGFS
jgi:hypothetical protein